MRCDKCSACRAGQDGLKILVRNPVIRFSSVRTETPSANVDFDSNDPASVQAFRRRG